MSNKDINTLHKRQLKCHDRYVDYKKTCSLEFVFLFFLELLLEDKSTFVVFNSKFPFQPNHRDCDAKCNDEPRRKRK